MPKEADDRLDLAADAYFGGIFCKAKVFPAGQEATIDGWSLKAKSDDFALIINRVGDVVLVCEHLAN
jgi:hypothetical protein